MAGDNFSLSWDNFFKNMSSGMNSLLETEELVDVTLAVEGKYLKAHKMVLSICSPYFHELFQMNPCKHPIVFMKDVTYAEMNYLLTFMYKGEVQVNQDNLASFIKTAEALQIKGLTPDSTNDASTCNSISSDENTNRITAKKKPPKMKNVSGPSSKKARIEQTQPSINQDKSSMEFKIEPCEQYEPDVQNVDEIPDISLIENPEISNTTLDSQHAGTSQDINEPKVPPVHDNNRKNIQRSTKARRKELSKSEPAIKQEETVIKKESDVEELNQIADNKVEVANKDADNVCKKILVLQNAKKEEATDSYDEDEQKFLDCLKKAVQNSNTPLQHVYKFNATLFPGVAKKRPYSAVVKAMKKWRYAVFTNQK